MIAGVQASLAPQPVIVAAVPGYHGGPQQIGMQVNGANHCRAEHEKLGILMRVLSWLEQVAQVAAQRPVEVLARAIDAGKRLLVQQARQAILLRPRVAA